jgi:hypothetical protein
MKFVAPLKAALLSAMLIGCSSHESTPRLATPAETSTIVGRLLGLPSPGLCVRSQLRLPLATQREYRKLLHNGTWWKVALDFVKSTLPGGARSELRWTEVRFDGQDVQLAPGTAERLQRLLDRATEASLRTHVTALNLPRGWEACSDDAHATGLVRYSFSQPVVIGDVAFIETAEDCGGLCGSGYVVALERQKAQWVPIGQNLEWLA